MDRRVDYIRTVTLPAYTTIQEVEAFNHANNVQHIHEAPPVIRRRDKNKKDNSGNRRSRPASWFVSHFSFDKLFHRGETWVPDLLG